MTLIFVLFVTRELTFDGRLYKFHYLVREFDFVKREPLEI